MSNHVLSKAFMLFTVILIACVFLWTPFQEKLSIEKVKTLESLILNGAQEFEYRGTDKNGFIHHLKAKKAKEVNENHYQFTDVIIKINTPQKKEITVKAKHLDYLKNLNIADLKGNVFMQTSDGTTLKTCKARVFIEKKYIEGDEYVESTKDNKKITANGFKMDDIEGEITFKSNSIFTSLPKDKEHS